MSNKHNHASYDFQQKLNVIKRIQIGETCIKVSRELGVLESTLHGRIKDENKSRTFLDELDKDGLRCKRSRQHYPKTFKPRLSSLDPNNRGLMALYCTFPF